MQIKSFKNKQRVCVFLSILAMILTSYLDRIVDFIPSEWYIQLAIMIVLIIIVFVLIEFRVLNSELLDKNIMSMDKKEVIKNLLKLIFSISTTYPGNNQNDESSEDESGDDKDEIQ